MARTRYSPGVYLLKALSIADVDLIIDNKTIPFNGIGETMTVYVNKNMSHTSGEKLQVRFVCESLDGISGRATL